ncbi:hypothetical protein D3C84_941330 [compost metagenome]
MRIIVFRKHLALQQVLNHGYITGQHQTNGNTTGDQVSINNTQPHKFHTLFVFDQTHNCIYRHGTSPTDYTVRIISSAGL